MATTTDIQHPHSSSLPTELWVDIFQRLDNRALLAVAQTCRHLHGIALALYLDQNEIAHPLGKDLDIVTDREHTNLPIIGALYPLSHVGTLAVTYRKLPVARLFKVIYATQIFVSRVASVRDFSIHLDYFDTGDLASSGADLLRALDALIGALDGKLHNLFYIDSQCYSYRGKWQGSSVPHLISRPLRSLSAVHIRGDFMFHEACIRWMTETLNVSPITSLHISLLSYVTTANWADFTGRLALPNLLTLNLDGFKGVRIRDLATFLRRHPTLRKLRCIGTLAAERTILGMGRTSALPASALPNLSELEANTQVAWLVLSRGAASQLAKLVLQDFKKSYERSRNESYSDYVQGALESLVGRERPLELVVGFYALCRDFLFANRAGQRDARVEIKAHCVRKLTILHFLHWFAYGDENKAIVRYHICFFRIGRDAECRVLLRG